MDGVAHSSIAVTFHHSPSFWKELLAIALEFLLAAAFIATALGLLLCWYEEGKKPPGQRGKERNPSHPWTKEELYRFVFCAQFSITGAFFVECYRYGGGWPSWVLFGLGIVAWLGLDPDNRWMK
jgi:hypothetical protein